MAGNITRFDPFSDIARFDPLRDMEQFLKDFRMMPSIRGVESESRIRMDVAETDQAYMVKAEMPGVKKEDIKVAIDGNQISISAEVKAEKQTTQNGNLMRSERYYGQIYRSFTLPQEVDDAKADAKYHDGILELTLPKKPGTGGKQLAIH